MLHFIVEGIGLIVAAEVGLLVVVGAGLYLWDAIVGGTNG